MKKPCKSYRSVLDALLDGTEDHASRAELEAHAQGCEACGHALEGAKRMRSMLETLVDGQSTRIDDEAFVASVFAEIDARPAPPVAAPNGTAPNGTARPWRLVLVGSMAAAAAAAILVTQQPRALEEPDPQSARGATGHQPGVGEMAATGPEDANPKDANPGPTSAGPGKAATAPPKINLTAASEPESPPENQPTPLTAEDVLGFRLALVEAAAELEFDPAQAEDGSRFAAMVESPLADSRRAARKLLDVGAAPTAQVQAGAALAARFLGPRADARDRILLKRSVEGLGAAGAWALVDRGGPGLASLWSLGLAQADDSQDLTSTAQSAGATARAVLFAAAKGGRLDLGALPRGRGDAALAAAVISAGGGDSADQLLEMFLRSGERPWLDVWASEEGALASLSSELMNPRNARGWDRRSSRLLEAVKRAQAPAGIAFTIRALNENVMDSGSVLAAIPGPAPVLALLRATQSGNLRDSMEEHAWSAMARAGSGRVLGAIFADAFEANPKAELLLDALVRSTGDALHTEEQRILGGLSASPELYSEIRSGALLLLAEKCGRRATKLLPELKATIAKLRDAQDARVAAAAWLVPLRSAKTPPNYVAGVLSRTASASVKHARLIRAIEKARARVAQRSF